MKLVAEAPRPLHYFTGAEWRWNNFDFVVVVLCLPGVSSLFGNVSFLRLMRLARVAKLVKKVPQLQMIVMGIVGGLSAIGYISLLLFLVFYLYAIAGIIAFKKNDPFHFRSLPVAMLTLFRAATLEDWTDVMYISIYGCHRYPGGIYTVEDLAAAARLLEVRFCERWRAAWRVRIERAAFVFHHGEGSHRRRARPLVELRRDGVRRARVGSVSPLGTNSPLPRGRPLEGSTDDVAGA